MNQYFSLVEQQLLEELILPVKDQCTKVFNKIIIMPNLQFFTSQLTKFLFEQKIEQRYYWQLLKNIILKDPSSANNFYHFDFENLYSPLLDNYILTILIAFKRNKADLNQKQVYAIKKSILLKDKQIQFKDIDIISRNLIMYKQLGYDNIILVNKNIELFLQLQQFQSNNINLLNNLVQQIDNSQFLQLKQVKNILNQANNVQFEYSFYYFPIQCQLSTIISKQMIRVLFQLYDIRRDTTEIKKAFTHIAQKIQLNQQLKQYFIELVLHYQSSSIQQILYFIKHIFPLWNNEDLRLILDNINHDSQLFLYIQAIFSSTQFQLVQPVYLLDNKQFQYYFYLLCYFKKWNLCQLDIYKRLISVEEFDYCCQQLFDNIKYLDLQTLMQLEPNQRFYYIQLLKDQQQLIEIGHDLLNVNCYNFLKVSTQLLVRLDTLHLQQLFTYYLLNFDPQLDSHHRCINLSRFIFKIAQQLQIENYVFLGVQCPSQVSHFVQKAFNFKNLDMILKSIFVVQQLQQIPQSLDYTAIVSFYYTQSVIQRPESSDNLDDFIPDIPNFSYDAENINAILPFSISPSLTEPAIQNQNIVAYFFHYLKSIIQLEISDELNRKFILYLFTVKIYPTLTFFSQFLKPCPGLKKIVKIALYKDGFSLRRKSAVAQKVFSLIYTQKEIENFYDQTSIQMVNIAAQYTPYQDITQNLDQYWVRRCAFAGALATNQDIQQDVFTDKNIQLEFIFIPTKITGTVAKLIILKHTKISVQYIDKVNIFLLNCCNEQITQWEQWQLVILGCQCLVFQNPIIKYEQLRALIKLDRQKWFDKAIYKLWGLSQQSLESMNSNQSIITSQ